ncbi:hypothetical protein V9N52_003895 [Vibrio navarrensis]
MKNAILTFITVPLLTSCSTAIMFAPLNAYEIGPKSHAQAAIEFNYSSEAADWSYQRYQITVYLSHIPYSGNFTLCDQKIDELGCNSGVSAWVNQLRQEPNTLWVSYDLHFLSSVTKNNGKLVPSINRYINEMLLTWDENEPVKDVLTYRISGKIVQESLSVRAYKL